MIHHCPECQRERGAYQQSLEKLTDNVKQFAVLMAQQEAALQAREQRLQQQEAALVERQTELERKQMHTSTTLDNVKAENEELKDRLTASGLKLRELQSQLDQQEQWTRRVGRPSIATADGRKNLPLPAIKRPPLTLPARILPVSDDLLERFEAGKAMMHD